MRRYVALAGIVGFSVVLFASGCGKDSSEQKTFTSEGNTDSAVQMDSKNMSAVKADMNKTVEKTVEFAPKNVATEFRLFPIYSDDNSPDNHYFPSGWMGDFSDVSINSAYLDNPHSGTTSMRIRYTNKASQGARWAGVYWQNPANNWGNRAGGYDLTGAEKLTFWVRGDKGGERIEEFKMGGINGEYSDTDIAGIGPIVLTTEWKQYTINLEGKDLSSIIGGFAWSANLDFNPEGATFYLDDIRYE